MVLSMIEKTHFWGHVKNRVADLWSLSGAFIVHSLESKITTFLNLKTIVSVAQKVGLCLHRSEIQKIGFLATRLKWYCRRSRKWQNEENNFNVGKRICVIGLLMIFIEDIDELAILSLHYRPRVRQGF